MNSKRRNKTIIYCFTKSFKMYKKEELPNYLLSNEPYLTFLFIADTQEFFSYKQGKLVPIL